MDMDIDPDFYKKIYLDIRYLNDDELKNHFIVILLKIIVN